MALSLTGSWSDRTVGVVDISVVQVAVGPDSEHISIAVIVVRRERPKRSLPKIQKQYKTNSCSINLFPILIIV